MANVTRIIANKKTFLNKDQEARNSIEDILINKQDNLTVTTPLSLTDNNLKIDLSSYYNKADIDNKIKNEITSINSKIQNNNNFIEKTKSYLKTLLNLNEDFTNTKNIPNVSDYNTKINSLETNISNLDIKLDSNKTELEKKIQTKINENATSLNNFKTETKTNENSLSQRIVFIEKELFGNTYEEGKTNFENSNSRIDILENKINQVFDKLVSAGLIEK